MASIRALLDLRRTDVALIAIVFLFDTFMFTSVLRDDEQTMAARLGIIAYSAVGAYLLIFRRRAPVLLFAALWAHALLALTFVDGYFPVLLLLVALEAVAELRSTTVSLVALAASFVPASILVVVAAQQASPEGWVSAAVGSGVFYSLITLLAWGVGRWARRHQREVHSLEMKHTLQFAEQREEADHAISEERLRIARELHDIVAHSVTIMVLHAAGAKRVVDTEPSRAKESLTTIEAAGKQAMNELRRLLELLREGDGETARSGSPLPGLAQLAAMIESVRASGVAVTLEVSGAARQLDTSIDLAAYRLVQEGLTNVTKHRGPGARATVSIEWGAEKVTVAVEDDGSGVPGLPATLSTGNGLVGLRERIAIAGGEFAAGPTEAGGYRVAARLPLSVLNTIASAPDAPEHADGHPARTVSEPTASLPTTRFAQVDP